MTVTYDPTTAARLIAEAREDDDRMEPAPWDCLPLIVKLYADDQPLGSNAFGIARTRNNLRALADQLEAASNLAWLGRQSAQALYERDATLEIAQGLLARWIKVGDLVDYSDVIGGTPTRLGLRVIEGPGPVGNGDWVVRLDGQHGWVSILAIRPREHGTKGFTMTDAEFDEWMEASPRTCLLWEAWEASREGCASGSDPTSRQRFTIWFHEAERVPREKR